MQLQAEKTAFNPFPKYVPANTRERGTNECVVSPHTFISLCSGVGNMSEQMGTDGNESTEKELNQ